MVSLRLIWPIVSSIPMGVPMLLLWAHSVMAQTVPDYTPAKERAWKHVQMVLMSSEYGGRSGVIERWVNSPSISIVGASASDQLFLQKLITNWNQILDASAIQLRHSKELQADIGVVFSERANFAEISAMYGFRIVDGGVGFAGMLVDHRHHARMALVLIDKSLSERERRATIAQELYHTLGPVNDSPYFPSSVLFEDTETPSTATELALVDRKLLKFLYLYLEPGDRQHEMQDAFDQFWDGLD